MTQLFRVCFVPALGMKDCFIKMFGTLEEAKTARETIAVYTLFIQEQGLMHDYSNMAYIEEFMDGEWCEVEEEIVYE